MADFGSVLRGLGSVLNPQVAQQLAQEQAQERAQQQQLGMFALQQQAAQQRAAEERDFAMKRLSAEQDFTRAENAKKIEGQFALHMADIKAKGEERLAAIRLAEQEKRITKEEADRRAEELRKELQARELAGREYLARLVGSMRPAPQPQMVTTPEGVFQVGRDGRAVPVVAPDGKPLTGKAPEKAIPASAAQKLFDNQQNLRRAEQALALMEGRDVGEMKGDANATGLKGYMPDAVLQRQDPQGVDARAAIADLGSLVIHDRSGAAVTAAEFPRLQPFIPSPKDDPDTARKKLKRFVQIYRDVTNETTNFYKESGYKVPELSGSSTVVDFGTLK